MTTYRVQTETPGNIHYYTPPEIIERLVKSHMDRTAGMSPDASALFANIQMNPARKLYVAELQQAALLLHLRYKRISPGDWLMYLTGRMGHRIVEPAFCTANMKIDLLTKTCVPISEHEPISIPPVHIPEPHPTSHAIPPVHIPDVPERETAVLDKKWLYLGAALALVLLLRK